MDRMRIRDLENELSEYVSEWMDVRWQEWRNFYKSIDHDRKTGIYRLKQGERLLDYLISIMENIGVHLDMEKGQHLIPSKFSSVNQFAKFLQNFMQYLRGNFNFLRLTSKGSKRIRLFMILPVWLMRLLKCRIGV